MRAVTSWRGLLLALCAGVILVALLGHRPVEAGGPLVVGGTFGVSGQPFTWDPASFPIGYRTDPGPLSATVNNATALTRVAGMFNVWQNVPTASISYINAGSILSVPGYVAGNDVDTVAEFNAVEGSCNTGAQSPIVFDADGSIFDALVGDPNVIGFAGPCRLSSTGGILSGEAALNGRFQDGINTPLSTPPNFELSTLAFDAAFIHEFGHFSGLDHSQLNVNCPACSAAELQGLPTMFPILVSTEMATLAPDDIAWISRLYPETVNNPPTQIPFASTFGTITGTIFFSDGVTHAQGVNVIARQVGNPGANAVSVVSGFLFTGNPGQSVTAGTPSDNVGGSNLGSRDVNLIGFYEIPGLAPGNYTVEVESIDPGFTVGSRVGPLDPPFPNPGANEFFSSPENDTDGGAPALPVTVTANTTTANINIVLNGTPPRFDSFEGRLWLPEPMPLWIRMLVPFLNSVAG